MSGKTKRAPSPILSPDAALLACCARWAAAEDQYSAVTAAWARTMDEPPAEVEEAAAAFCWQAQAALEEAAALPALTEEGRRAKARTVMRVELTAGQSTDASKALTRSLLRDVLAADPFLAAHDEARAAMARLAGISQAGTLSGPLYDEAHRACETGWLRFTAMGVTAP